MSEDEVPQELQEAASRAADRLRKNLEDTDIDLSGIFLNPEQIEPMSEDSREFMERLERGEHLKDGNFLKNAR